MHNWGFPQSNTAGTSAVHMVKIVNRCVANSDWIQPRSLVRRLWFTLMFSTARLLLTARARADVYEFVMEIVDGLIEADFNVVADASFLMCTDRQVDPGAIIKALRSFK